MVLLLDAANNASLSVLQARVLFEFCLLSYENFSFVGYGGLLSRYMKAPSYKVRTAITSPHIAAFSTGYYSLYSRDGEIVNSFFFSSSIPILT